jgi:HAMP domain-containing protein
VVVSARARIVGWCVLLVALALGTSVLVAGRVLLARVDKQAADELVHEGDKLRAYAARSVDPRTGQPFSTVDGMLTGFLRDNLPDRDETFFSVVGGRADHRSSQHPLARLDTDPAVVAFAAAATSPASRTVPTSAGAAMIAIYPVRMAADPRPAALVVVEFVAPARAEAWSVIRLLAFIGFGALAIAGLAACLIAGRVLRPIRLVRRTAERISDSDLTSRIDVTGTDDVAQLARTFNRMLDRLQAAFAAQRDFLDDAGHELRTPLTILRGHLELMGDDPAERAQTVPLLLDEIDRMRRIVDDLIVLAQANRPDFLHLGPTDLADVVVDLVAKGVRDGAAPLADRLGRRGAHPGRRAAAHPGDDAAGGQRGGAHRAGRCDRRRRCGGRRPGATVGAGQRVRRAAGGCGAHFPARGARHRQPAGRGGGAGAGHRDHHRRGARRHGDAGQCTGRRRHLHVGPAAAPGSGDRQPARGGPVRQMEHDGAVGRCPAS